MEKIIKLRDEKKRKKEQEELEKQARIAQRKEEMNTPKFKYELGQGIECRCFPPDDSTSSQPFLVTTLYMRGRILERTGTKNTSDGKWIITYDIEYDVGIIAKVVEEQYLRVWNPYKMKEKVVARWEDSNVWVQAKIIQGHEGGFVTVHYTKVQ